MGVEHLRIIQLIDERPPEVNARTVAGDWEGNLIIGAHYKSALLVTVERKTRFVQIDLLESYKAEIVRKKVVARFKKLHPLLVSTLTLDQGKENAEHERIALELKI